jgi:apolipoprotein D and lipocalin family protein
MKKLVLFALLAITMSYSVFAQPLRTVPIVHLDRYVGTWYEIASYPSRFQKGCHCTTATYTMSDKGYVVVENRCNRDSVNGKASYIKGKAFVEEGSGNAKLNVQFFWPCKGQYWIIDLAQDYSYAVVGHPNRKYLWILSRTPRMANDVYDGILSRLEGNGYDTTKLDLTDQKWLPIINN